MIKHEFEMTVRLNRWLEVLKNTSTYRPKMRPQIIAAAIAAASVYIYLRRRLASAKCRSGTLLHGKTVIVTGANRGIGKETARELARRGARVIMACRDVEKGHAAAKQIQADARGDLIVYQLDLSSFRSIRNFAEKIIKLEERVDILINNAGVICPKATTEDGLDMQFATNYLGPFLLTLLLRDKLKASAPARIINTSSALHNNGVLIWDDLNMEKRPGYYKPMKAYAQSKLAVILFSRELASRLSGSRVNVYTVDPGWIKHNQTRHCFDKYSPWLTTAVFNFISMFLPLTLTAKEACQTTVYCAVEKKLERQNGLYYKDCDAEKPSDSALDNLNTKTLWEVSMKMAGLQD